MFVTLLAALLVPYSHGASPWPSGSSALALQAVSELSLADRVSWLHGHSIFDVPYVGNVPGYSRGNLSLPPLHLEDGPQGVADETTYVTAFPSAGTVLMTWDTDLYFAFGAAMAAEQHAKGVNIALTPAVNLARVPWAGRVFEWLGEDPFLAAAMARHQVLGLQTGTNVSACVKHLVLNSQEFERNSVSETASRRTLWELYYPPFQAAVDAGVGSAMCAYNRIRGAFACENAETLGDLKNRMGFKGPIMSDWYATHSTLPAALAGLDQEMPGGFFFSDALQAAAASGALPAARLQDMVVRVLTPLFALGLTSDPPPPSRNVFSNATSAAHNALALALAEASIVLLRNEGGLLPLTGVASWAVFGDEVTVAGEGSGGVNLPYLVTPAEGVRAVAGGAPVAYVDGHDPAAAGAAAAAAGACVVVVGVTSAEGTDRADLALPAWQNAMVAAVAAANPRTVVVVRCPGACKLPWADTVPAILYEMMPGQESGNSIGRTLVGLNNPSGRLALSFPADENTTWLGARNASRYPGVDSGKGYLEGAAPTHLQAPRRRATPPRHARAHSHAAPCPAQSPTERSC